MRSIDITPLAERQNPYLSAFTYLIIALIGFVIVGPGLGTVLIMLLYDGSMNELLQKLADPFGDPDFKKYYFTLQGFATGVGLIVIPLLFLKGYASKTFRDFSPVKKYIPLAFALCILIMGSFIIVNSWFIEFNSGLSLPESMSGIEQWMRQTEEQAARLTEYMTTFDSPGLFLIAILVIAVLPSIGEELVFRGMIQRELTAAFGNGHLAIWISAILFSAIHLQFFGFIPRMLLGALFGYLFYWSGNMTYPILAHFLNNGGQLVILYMAQKGVIDVDMESNESFPLTVIIIFVFITFGLLYYFKKIHSEQGNGSVEKGVFVGKSDQG